MQANMYQEEIDMSDADFEGQYMATEDYSGFNLTRANFNNAYLNQCNFSGANLTGANFTSAYLADANFTGANLTGATLTGATLINTDFTGATLDNVTAEYIIDGSNVIGYDVSGLVFVPENDRIEWDPVWTVHPHGIKIKIHNVFDKFTQKEYIKIMSDI